MAETDNLDENIDDAADQALGDVPEDGMPDDVPSDEGALEDVGAKRSIKDLLSDRKVLMIGGGALGVLILGFILWSVFAPDPQPKGLSNRAALEATLDQERLTKELAKKKSKKKVRKKKIKFISLYKQLDRRQLSDVIKELSYNDIAFDVEQTGKQFEVLVDSEQLEKAKRLLAIKGIPSGTAKGFEIFDAASNLGVTEFDKRIRLIRALSGELERSIMDFDAIDTAQVEIVIPEPRLFAVTQPPVTASILLRKRPEALITDDIVYSIIQMASNSVENLQPENISIVDTTGRLLSSGVVERMSEKQRIQQMKARSLDYGEVPSPKPVGKVVVPSVDDIVDWFEIKNGYERLLESKAFAQLVGVLPEGSFKVAVTIDMRTLKKSGMPDIKRMTASIVVDSARDDIVLDEYTKNQIHNAVAGSIGYVQGRDDIVLSRAAFVATPELEEEPDFEEEFEEETALKEVVKKGASKLRFIKYWPLLAMGSTVLMILFGFIQIVRTVVRRVIGVKDAVFAKDSEDKEFVSADDSIKMIKKEDVLEISEETDVLADDIEQIKSLGSDDPSKLAALIQEWMQEEVVSNE